MNFQPEILKFNDGRKVLNVQDWAKKREEILEIFRTNEYGRLPEIDSIGRGEVKKVNKVCCSGHAVLETVEITAKTEKGEYSWPIKLFMPTGGKKKYPLFVHLSFHKDDYDMYYPAEEIIDHDYALAVIVYNDVTMDNADFSDGLAAHFTRTPGDGFGKIALWAWSASRTLDYLLTRPEIDPDTVAVIGHSRLGKTALWAGAQDERFKFVISNDSGCAGAAYERVKIPEGETFERIQKVFPYWFCENFQKFKNPNEAPFDQHMLVALSAPRYVCVDSASLDLWADPYAEQLSCIAASPVWKLFGKEGFVGPERPAKENEAFLSGEIAYFLREGTHYLSRWDWLNYMKYIDQHTAWERR